MRLCYFLVEILGENMKNFKLLVAASALVSGVAFAGGPDVDAQPQPVSVNQGFFVTANIGGGTSNFSGDYSLSGYPNVTTGNFAWNVGGGYQFNQYIAGEVDYMWLPTIDFPGGAYLRSSLVDFVAKLMYPVNQQIDVFAKAGVGAAFGSVSGNGISISTPNTVAVGVFGGGLDYFFTQNIGADAQFLYTTGNNTNSTPHSYTGLVGLTYRFI